MTRRERLERKAERRREWAASREARSDRHWSAARSLLDPIPLGQPILVGHHSEKRHRRTVERADANMRAACESAEMAKHHASRAAGIEAQLAGAIYSDDPDALEALEARVAELEKRAERMAAIRKATRKAYKANDPAAMAAAFEALGMTDAEKADALSNMRHCWTRDPMPAYAVTNVRGNLARQRKRLEGLRADREQRARVEAALAAEGAAPRREVDGFAFRVVIDGPGAFVHFEEKPSADVRALLKAAYFRWDSIAGAWKGAADYLPEPFRA